MAPISFDSEESKQAAAVSVSGSVGEVSGVRVDFRHHELPEGEWQARFWWHLWRAGEESAGLIFPREAGFNLDAIVRLLSLEDMPRIYAEAGDSLTLTGAVKVESEHLFDHPHDTAHFLASWRLTKAGGGVVNGERPIAFYGVSQLRDAPPVEGYDRLIERIGDLSDVEELAGSHHAFNHEASKLPSLRERAKACAFTAEEYLKDIRDDYQKGLIDDGVWESVARALSSAALMGFYQGKAELRKAERMASGSLRGGRTRKAKAKDNRFAYAELFWNETPGISLSALARKVIEELYWRDDQPMISESAMKDSLRAAIARSEIPGPEKG